MKNKTIDFRGCLNDKTNKNPLSDFFYYLFNKYRCR